MSSNSGARIIRDLAGAKPTSPVVEARTRELASSGVGQLEVAGTPGHGHIRDAADRSGDIGYDPIRVVAFVCASGNAAANRCAKMWPATTMATAIKTDSVMSRNICQDRSRSHEWSV